MCCLVLDWAENDELESKERDRLRWRVGFEAVAVTEPRLDWDADASEEETTEKDPLPCD